MLILTFNIISSKNIIKINNMKLYHTQTFVRQFTFYCIFYHLHYYDRIYFFFNVQ